MCSLEVKWRTSSHRRPSSVGPRNRLKTVEDLAEATRRSRSSRSEATMPERSEEADEVARLRAELAYWQRRCEVAERRASEWVLRCDEAMKMLDLTMTAPR